MRVNECEPPFLLDVVHHKGGEDIGFSSPSASNNGAVVLPGTRKWNSEYLIFISKVSLGEVFNLVWVSIDHAVSIYQRKVYE